MVLRSFRRENNLRMTQHRYYNSMTYPDCHRAYIKSLKYQNKTMI